MDSLDDRGPVFGPLNESLGEARFTRFWTGHSEVNAMLLALTMSVTFASSQGYSDEMLAVIEVDAQDLIDSATKHAAACKELANHWRAQRQEQER